MKLDGVHTTDNTPETGNNASDAGEWEVITQDEREEAAAYDRDYGHTGVGCFRIEVGDKYYQRNFYAGIHQPGCNCGSSADGGKQ